MTDLKLAHVCIHSHDLEKTKAFYKTALGLDTQFTFKKGEGEVGFYLSLANNAFIEFFHVDSFEESRSHLVHLCLETKDIESTRQRLLSHGVEVGEIKMGADHSYQCWVTDPDGVRIEFHQYTPESSQYTGDDVEVNW